MQLLRVGFRVPIDCLTFRQKHGVRTKLCSRRCCRFEGTIGEQYVQAACVVLLKSTNSPFSIQKVNVRDHLVE